MYINEHAACNLDRYIEWTRWPSAADVWSRLHATSVQDQVRQIVTWLEGASVGVTARDGGPNRPGFWVSFGTSFLFNFLFTWGTQIPGGARSQEDKILLDSACQWVLGMGLAARHTFGAWNCKVSRKFLENLWTLAFHQKSDWKWILSWTLLYLRVCPVHWV